jgi:hypothetical protein
MKRKINVISLILIVTLLLAACYSIPPAEVSNSETLNSVKTAYIVDNPKVIGAFQVIIAEALEERGIHTQTGLMSNKPKDVDIYVTYLAYHSWDMARYLKSLVINIYDNKSNELIATDNFSTGFFHDFANSRKVTNILINNMFDQ